MSRDLNHLRLAFFVLVAGIFYSELGLARDIIFQNPDTTELNQVEVQNKSRLPETVWVLFYENEFIEEHAFEVPARSTKILSLDGLKKPRWNFSVLTKSALVKPVSENSAWTSATSTRYEMKIKNQNELKLKFFNLYLEKQKVSLSFINANQVVLQSSEFHTAAFRQNIERLEKVPAGSTRLIIQSEAPLQISSSDIFMPVTDQARKVSSEFKYFLVQGGRDGTNFIAPMNDPEMILKARQEILNPQGYIVFAEIELNPDQANRNFASSEKPYWSWSIKQVTGMSQIGADWCQAYPEMIERMLHGFLRQQSVCFRGQRIIRELKPNEVQSGRLNP